MEENEKKSNYWLKWYQKNREVVLKKRRQRILCQLAEVEGGPKAVL
jgi:hypothetical protein